MYTQPDLGVELTLPEERGFAAAPRPRCLQPSMTMLTSTAAGDAYTFRELSDMHTKAGFSGVKAHPVPMSPHTIVMARA